MFIGVYLIMVNDPQILFNDGFYPLLHVVMPEGCLLAPRYPAALGCRTHALTRLFDVLGGALDKQAPGAQHGGRLRHLAVHALQRLEGRRRVLLRDGDPLRRHPRPADRRRDGRPLVVAAVREHPDGVPRGLLPAADRRLHDGHRLRRRGLPPRRQRGREALRVPRAGPRLDPRRPLADAAVGRARRRAGRALDEAPAARRRHRGGAAGQVRRGRGAARRHADLPHRGRRRLEGPARPAGRGGRARRGVRARLAPRRRAPSYGVRGRRRGGHRGRAGAPAGGARRRAGVRLRARAGRRGRQLRGRDRAGAAAARRRRCAGRRSRRPTTRGRACARPGRRRSRRGTDTRERGLRRRPRASARAPPWSSSTS